MKIKGHSNFKVLLIQKDNKFFVRKSAYTKEDGERLYRQFYKQYRFLPLSNKISTPKLYEFNKVNEGYFDMEYINGLSFAELFEKKGWKYIETKFNEILDWVEENINSSSSNIRFLDVSDPIIVKYNRVKDIISLTDKPIRFKYLDELFYNLEEVILPIMPNHGDLTFSNILFDENNNKIVFIDFLDSFIETPLNDIVKLRQDTKHKWSINLLEEKRDITKLNIIFDRLDKIIDNRFQKYGFYQKHYKIYQILNLLRILQYSKDQNITEYLIKEIEELI